MIAAANVPMTLSELEPAFSLTSTSGWTCGDGETWEGETAIPSLTEGGGVVGDITVGEPGGGDGA